MKQDSAESNLIQILRLLIGLRLGLSLLLIGGEAVLLQRPVQPDLLLSIADAVFLLGYLSWPWLQRRLGRAFLPIALVVASVGPIVEYNLIQAQLITFEASRLVGRAIDRRLIEEFTLAPGTRFPIGAWQLFPILFIPLVLIGGRYNFRSVIVFCFGTALLDSALTVLLVGVSHPRFFSASVVVVRTASLMLVGYVVVRLMTTQRDQREALTRANAQLTRYASTLEQLAISHERNRLARELHDTLAHTLSAVAVQLEAAGTLWDADSAKARAMLTQSLAVTRSGLNETRRALQALRASPLEDLGLALAIRNLAESVAIRAGLTLDLRVPERLDNLTPDLEQCIYRITQESLTNIAQHADAHHVNVRLDRTDHRLTLTISDDGHGFDPAEVNSDVQFGLKGMRERAQIVGGTLEVESHPGRGTTIRFVVGGE